MPRWFIPYLMRRIVPTHPSQEHPMPQQEQDYQSLDQFLTEERDRRKKRYHKLRDELDKLEDDLNRLDDMLDADSDDDDDDDEEPAKPQPKPPGRPPAKGQQQKR